MAESEMATLTIAEAVKLLKIYGCSPEKLDSVATSKQLREALLLVTKESEWENLGICADNLSQGLNALGSYLKALGYSYSFSQQHHQTEESVYIKFNTRQMNYYVDSYNGSSRGVLIATQGSEEAVLGTFGYFPLDLFT